MKRSDALSPERRFHRRTLTVHASPELHRQAGLRRPFCPVASPEVGLIRPISIAPRPRPSRDRISNPIELVEPQRALVCPASTCRNASSPCSADLAGHQQREGFARETLALGASGCVQTAEISTQPGSLRRSTRHGHESAPSRRTAHVRPELASCAGQKWAGLGQLREREHLLHIRAGPSVRDRDLGQGCEVASHELIRGSTEDLRPSIAGGVGTSFRNSAAMPLWHRRARPAQTRRPRRADRPRRRSRPPDRSAPRGRSPSDSPNGDCGPSQRVPYGVVEQHGPQKRYINPALAEK